MKYLIPNINQPLSLFLFVAYGVSPLIIWFVTYLNIHHVYNTPFLFKYYLVFFPVYYLISRYVEKPILEDNEKRWSYSDQVEAMTDEEVHAEYTKRNYNEVKALKYILKKEGPGK